MPISNQAPQLFPKEIGFHFLIQVENKLRNTYCCQFILVCSLDLSSKKRKLRFLKSLAKEACKINQEQLLANPLRGVPLT